jgi:ribonuclease Z
MEFSFTPLGISAAQPAYGRGLAAHVFRAEPELYLIDCGEGTQFQLNKYGIKRHRIGHIFISHLHGDHFFGLIGLLTSMGMNDRREPLTVHAPPGLEQLIRFQLEVTGTDLSYPLSFHELRTDGLHRILETRRLEVFSFPLHHRTPTAGFLFREKPVPRNIRPEVIDQYTLDFEQIREIKAGADLELPDGRLVSNRELTLPPYRQRSLAYCSDTAYFEEMIPHMRGVDLLYHESTFREEDAELAAQTFHSTARQAAQIAQQAGVGQLLLGHFSARYPDARVLLEEARAVFPAAQLAEEGREVVIPPARETE